MERIVNKSITAVLLIGLIALSAVFIIRASVIGFSVYDKNNFAISSSLFSGILIIGFILIILAAMASLEDEVEKESSFRQMSERAGFPGKDIENKERSRK